MNLAQVTLPSTLGSLGECAFEGCSALTGISLPASLGSIGGAAFAQCASLQSIDVPEGVTVIPESAFMGCQKLTSVSIPGAVGIGFRSFCECASLQSFDFPESVRTISDQAFMGCDMLNDLTFPSGIVSIGRNIIGNLVFYDELENRIDDPVSGLPGHRFHGFGSGFHRIASDGDTLWCIAEGTLILVGGEIRDHSPGDPAPWGKGFSAVRMDGVVRVGDYAFRGCEGLKNVFFDNEIRTIGKHAFDGCSAASFSGPLTDITRVDEYGFASCAELEFVPSYLESVGMYAFSGCASMKEFACSERMTSIAGHAFEGCTGIDSVELLSNSNIVDIGESAFGGCTGLEAIILSDSVVSVGAYAFRGCEDSILFISFGEGLESLDRTAFEDLTFWHGEQEITDVEDLRGKSFFSDDGRRMVSMDPVGDLYWYLEDGNLLIFGEGRMSDFNQDKQPPWGRGVTAVYIDEGAENIGEYAFYGCTKLVQVMFPDSLVAIGDHALEGCTALSGITVGGGRMSVGESAFEG